MPSSMWTAVLVHLLVAHCSSQFIWHDRPDQSQVTLGSTEASTVRRTLRFAVFGDSWASGINYGPPSEDLEYDFGNDEEVCRCRRVSEAWPVQLLHDDGSWAQRYILELDHQACHGAGFGDIADQVRRLDQTRTPDLAFLMVGGNDGRVGAIIENCIGQFDMGKNYGPEYPDPDGECFKTLRDAKARVHSDDFVRGLIDSVRTILNQPRIQHNPHFKLFVLSYSGLFNHDDPACDAMTFGLWGGKQPKLTRELRRAINSVIDEGRREYDLRLNHWLGDPRVKYLDANAVLGGHRFCEPTPHGNMQEMYENAWLYHLDWPECIPLENAYEQTWNESDLHTTGFCRKCGGLDQLGEIQRW